MKSKYFLSVAFLFFLCNVSVNSMQLDSAEESIKNRLTTMTETYLCSDPIEWTKELYFKGLCECKIHVATDLAYAVEYGFIKILQGYMMHCDPQLTIEYEGRKNLLFYVVSKQNIESIQVVLECISEEKDIINIKNDEGKTVVELFLEECLCVSDRLSKNHLKILKMLMSHKYFDFNQKNNDGRTAEEVLNVYINNLQANHWVLSETFSDVKANKSSYWPTFCAIL